MSFLLDGVLFCLISIQERTNNHKLSAICNTKSTFKTKASKNIVCLKSKLSFCYSLA